MDAMNIQGLLMFLVVMTDRDICNLFHPLLINLRASGECRVVVGVYTDEHVEMEVTIFVLNAIAHYYGSECHNKFSKNSELRIFITVSCT